MMAYVEALASMVSAKSNSTAPLALLILSTWLTVRLKAACPLSEMSVVGDSVFVRVPVKVLLSEPDQPAMEIV